MKNSVPWRTHVVGEDGPKSVNFSIFLHMHYTDIYTNEFMIIFYINLAKIIV